MIIVITGALGVGKTTISKEVTKRIRGIYFSIDEVLHKHGLDLIAKGSYCIPLKNFLKANKLLQKDITIALASKKHVVVDGCFYHLAALKDLLKYVPQPHCIFTLQAPIHVCIRRDANCEKPLGQEAARAVYRLTSRLVLGEIIDTTQPLEKAIERMFQVINSCTKLRR